MTIAEMYMRIKADTILHSRQVFSLMNWLGAIGGIKGILMDLVIFLFGGYASFNAVLEAYNSLRVESSLSE